MAMASPQKGNPNRWRKRRKVQEKMAKMRKSRRGGRREVEEPPRLPLDEEEPDETPTMDIEEEGVSGLDDQESVVDEDDAFLDDCDLYSIAKEWIRQRERSREDVQMVTALLYGYIRSSTRMNVKAASTSTAKAVGRDEKTVRTWMASLKSNGGIPLPFGGGKYHRVSIMTDKDCRRAATAWIRENASRKGVGNMTIKGFQRYLNTDLLPGMHVPPEFPKSVSETTAKRFLHDLGFVRRRTSQKSVYMDGHERQDVIKYRSEYIARLQSIERRHQIPPLPSDAVPGEPQPGVVGSPGAPKQLVTIFHDETVFQSNEDQEWAWAQPDQYFIRKKGRGSGIMISDVIEEHGGFLRSSEKIARKRLEFGEKRDGYWTCEKFIEQIKWAVEIADEKYPSTEYSIVWIFDHSSNHSSKGKDALVADRMNVSSGGNQPKMRDTVFEGRPFKMVLPNGEAKGLRLMLEERGVD